MSGTIYTPSNYHKAQRALIAAKFSNFNLTEKPITSDVEKQFSCCPPNSVPLFQKTGSNEKFFEANAIAHFVGNDQLRGVAKASGDASGPAQVTQWVNWADLVVMPAVATLTYPQLGVCQLNKTEAEKARIALSDAMTNLNAFLASRTFLVGQSVTQADITIFTVLRLPFQLQWDSAERADWPHLVRWFTTIANQKQVLDVVGPSELCEKKAAPFDAKKFAELHPKGAAGSTSARGKQPSESAGDAKKEAPKKQQNQQSKKQKETPKKKEEEQDDEVEFAQEEKKKDVFAEMPKGTFIFDEFKRTYSNNDAATVAIPYFWKNFDAQANSIWYCDYLFNDELRMIFMSSNLIGGMFQRLDKLRKYAFASMIVFGENKNSSISGLWVVRGQELPFTLDKDLDSDYESYKWTKLDPNSAETKKLVEEYFTFKGDFKGRKVADSKIFK